MKGAKSVLRLLTLMREGGDGECDGELEEINALNSAALTQAGHSIKTAFRKYAHSSAPGEISLLAESSRIEGFRMASQEWHVDIGLRDSGPGTGSRPAPQAATETPAVNEAQQ